MENRREMIKCRQVIILFENFVCFPQNVEILTSAAYGYIVLFSAGKEPCSNICGTCRELYESLFSIWRDYIQETSPELYDVQHARLSDTFRQIIGREEEGQG